MSMKEMKFAKNQVIFKQGDAGDAMFEVRAGSVGIYLNFGEKGEKLLTKLEKGEVFGEMGLIDRMPRSADAVALEDGATLWKVDEHDFTAYYGSNPEMALRIMRHLSERLRTLTGDYLEACRTIAETEQLGKGSRSERLRKKISRFMDVWAEATRFAPMGESSMMYMLPGAFFMSDVGEQVDDAEQPEK